MLTTDRLIFLQLQKTGGTHVARILEDHLGAVQATKHRRLTGRRDERAVIGAVRNPWDWYVSLWAYGCEGHGMLRRRLTAAPGRAPGPPTDRLLYAFNERRRPAAQWQRAYEPEPGAEPTRFREWLRFVLDPARRFDLHEGYGFSRVWRAGGLYSFRFLRLYDAPFRTLMLGRGFRDADELRRHHERHCVVDHFIRQERLDADLGDVLRRVHPEMTDEQRRAITDAGEVRTNVSERREASYYFDDETSRLVGRRERFLVELFGYEPPTPADS